jgi:hypothetical protein
LVYTVKIRYSANGNFPRMSPPCRGGGGGGVLRASMTLRAMPAGTYVPGRASQAGHAVREKPDSVRQTGAPRMGVLWMGL